MLRRIDDWFIMTNNNIFGEDVTGKIVPFDTAGFRGFRGEGGARDAQRLLWDQGEKTCALVRLEMRIAKLTEAGTTLTSAKSWVIIRKQKRNYQVFGLCSNGEVLPISEIGSEPFTTYQVLREKADAFTKSQLLKPKNVRIATFALHVL